MSRRISRVAIAGFLLSALALASPIPAAERVVKLDPKASEVSFTLDATMHVVHGTLRLTSGEVRFDPDTGAASGEVKVDARSAETGNARRDKKMHETILESERYPEMVFRLLRIEGRVETTGRSEVKLVGTMSLHGGDHPMTLPASVTADSGTFTADVRFDVPYVEWGMEDPSFMIVRVAKTVAVSVRAVGRIE